ncbi:MAG: gamma-glutamyltransferase [Bacteroidales bacterium]|nr:gamma-glutamyltransferase [Bacteroidales bacterium]
MKRFTLGILAILILAQCNPPTAKKNHMVSREVITDSAMVVCARTEASKIGIKILKEGGNAFDAMIATSFALAVSYPFAGNIAGGGFMVYQTRDGKTGTLDFREKAPLAASRNMYLDSHGNVIKGASTLGGLSVGVPGTIDGLFQVYKKFGTLPFDSLIQPAIDLAKKGVVVTKKQAERINHYRKYFAMENGLTIPLDKDWKAGDTIKYPQLAKTLERIRDNGRKEFYEGETADMLVSYLKKHGGIITKKDLAQYQAKWRKAIVFDYKDARIISMPPPSSGGVCIAEILNAIEPFPVATNGHNTTKYIQLLTEAERRAFADRDYFLGDADYVKMPIDTLISPAYARRRMANFSWKHATPSSEIAHGDINGFHESMETTHFSIVDKFGNAVSVTTTLNGAYGSKLYVPEGGFFLNNEMDDFSSKPGTPNQFGLIGGEANSIQPGKRMLSSMSPTIIDRKGKLYMVLGSPGGSTIITSVVQTFLNVYEFNMTMQQAVDAPRFHMQWLPDDIQMEPGRFSLSLQDSLHKLGYTIDTTNAPVIGKVDAILIMPDGKLEGGADYRGDDKSVGY